MKIAVVILALLAHHHQHKDGCRATRPDQPPFVAYCNGRRYWCVPRAWSCAPVANEQK
jgi:hypothetical protein